MRMIGHLPDEASAIRFSDFLYVEGIKSAVEAEKDGWAVWIHSEDELDKAKSLLASFLENPRDPRFQSSARQARELKEREREEQLGMESRIHDRRKVFRRSLPYGAGWLTMLLVLVSVAVSVASRFGKESEFLAAFVISKYPKWVAVLPEILEGEVWRLLTPVFLHLGVLHLFFNMLWLLDLGSMIEGRQNSRRLVLLVVVIGVASNLGQYWMSGPGFGGMSGVVYGLLGYVWMKGKFDPASGLFLHPQTVTMMLIWFFLCFTEWVGQIANTAHGVGLVLGMGWGYLSTLDVFKRRSG